MIYAGPCLLTPDQAAIDDCYKTAERLASIDKNIRFRCKLWGGGTRPDRYVEGIGVEGLKILNNISKKLLVGTEIKDSNNLKELSNNLDFLWIAARSMQNYSLLEMRPRTYGHENEILIKRNPGATIDEVIGIHDICRDIYGYKSIMVERGINTFCRTEKQRWTPDFSGMLRLIQERPDIELCFDPSHACGVKEHIFPMVKAAKAIGVKHYMIEVMNDPSLSQTDKNQILSIEEFKAIYKYVEK